MGLPLVVGVDGSESSLRAVDWAADEAHRFGLALRVVHASVWQRYEEAVHVYNAQRSPGHLFVDHIVAAAAERARARRPTLDVSMAVLPENAGESLLDEAHRATALVTGSHGRGPLAELFLGSVSAVLVARADCPVIVVRGTDAALAGEHGRVAVGIGDAAPAAVDFAVHEAAGRGAALDALRAWFRPAHHPPDARRWRGGDPDGEPAGVHEEHASHVLDEALRYALADHPEATVHRVIAEGPPHKVLADHSAATDLLVLGAHRRHGHVGAHVGRVTHFLLHHADCPVAVVPPPQPEPGLRNAGTGTIEEATHHDPQSLRARAGTSGPPTPPTSARRASPGNRRARPPDR
ncbi:universal stress protein [Streptomyces sp. NPDC002004]